MRKSVCGFFLLAALIAGGCWPQGPLVLWPKSTTPPGPPVAKADAPVAPRPRAPVTVDQVHLGNAREQAQALREEVDREQARASGR